MAPHSQRTRVIPTGRVVCVVCVCVCRVSLMYRTQESLRRAMEAVHGRTAKEDINALLDSITHPTSSPLSLEDVASHPFTSLTCPYVRHFLFLRSFFALSRFTFHFFLPLPRRALVEVRRHSAAANREARKTRWRSAQATMKARTAERRADFPVAAAEECAAAEAASVVLCCRFGDAAAACSWRQRSDDARRRYGGAKRPPEQDRFRHGNDHHHYRFNTAGSTIV